MQLAGSCHCGQVSFRLDSAHPFPFNLCYCSICRKTAGGGGYAINLGGDHSTLQITGEDDITVYRARIPDPETGATIESPAQRHFCRVCGSALWAWDPRWPELVHPFASAIDTVIPPAPEKTHLMTSSKASWVEIQAGPSDKIFNGYPDESIAEWHQRLGVSKGS